MSRYSLKEVSNRDGINGARTWIVINDYVYDVTDYLGKHPGGRELIEEYAGKDATAAFDEFGHSSDAKRTLKNFLVGELIDEDKKANRKKKNNNNQNSIKIEKSDGCRRRPFLTILCGGCA